MEAVRAISDLSDADRGRAIVLISDGDQGFLKALGIEASKWVVEAYLDSRRAKVESGDSALLEKGGARLKRQQLFTAQLSTSKLLDATMLICVAAFDGPWGYGSRLGLSHHPIMLVFFASAVAELGAERGAELALARAGLSKPRSLQEFSFSKVGSAVASNIFMQLGIHQDNGHLLDPLEPPTGGFPKCREFDMSTYPDEDKATPDYLEHIEACLQLNGVTFGRNGFHMVDVHMRREMFKLRLETSDAEMILKGGMDGVIVPFGVAESSPHRQIRCGIEVKHSPEHKARHMERYGHPASGKEQGVEYSGTVQGQAMVEELAAVVYAEHPRVMLLVSSFDHNTILLWDNGVVISWTNISFDAAMFKMAEFLKSCSTDRHYTLPPAAQPEQFEPTLRLRKRLRAENVLLEQLDSLTIGMSCEEKYDVALEFFRAHRQHLGDLGLMYS